jgi:hypothetical protein
MSIDILHLNLIHFLDFYFSLFFFLGTYRRFQQYQSIGRLALAGPGRWPRMLKLISEHRMLFLTWRTLLPTALALTLTTVQLVASRFLWPEAGEPPDGLTIARLGELWPAMFAVVPLGVAMMAYDSYTLVLVYPIDRKAIEEGLDYAESWLAYRPAEVARVVTLGYFNVRRMVSDEVRKQLVQVSDTLNASLWWWVRQLGLRFAFGLSLWVTWAVGHAMR